MSVPRRPLSLTITAVGIFLLAMWNVWRALIIARQSALLQPLGVTLDPHLRLALAGLWAVVFLLLALGLWQRRWIVRYLLPGAVFLYGIIHLGMWLFFTLTPVARQGWFAQLILLIVATAWTTWVCLRQAHRGVWLRNSSGI